MKDIPMIDPVTELKKLFDAKKFDAAIEFCQKLLVKNPNDPIALQNLSTAYYIVGAYNDTIKCCDKILEKDVNEEHAVKNKMLALEKLEIHDEVLKCCEILLSKNDKDVDALVTKGISLNKIGKHEDALTLYDLALELDKTNVDALMNMAVTLSYLRRYQDAIPYYDTVQQMMPEFSRAAVEKSKAFKELGREDDAFLAAQGVRLKDAELLKQDAKDNKYSVQHAFLLKRYKSSEKKN
jgi:tetratricopeptide (TPR) repeat protein